MVVDEFIEQIDYLPGGIVMSLELLLQLVPFAFRWSHSFVVSGFLCYEMQQAHLLGFGRSRHHE